MAEMYLYNGVKLPALPERDKEKFPYAVICYNKNEETYLAYFSDRELAYQSSSSQMVNKSSIYSVTWTYVSLVDGEWVGTGYNYLLSGGQYLSSGRKPIWADYDLYNKTTNNTYLAASDPVLVQPTIPVFFPAAQFSGLMAGRRIAGQRRPKVPDISDALVNISMDNGVNLAGDAAYNASVSNGGAFADGRFVVDGSGALTIPADFMAGTQPWTVAFTIDSYVLNSAKTYCRVARGNQDVPSIFYMTSRGKHHAKLATKTISSSNVAWYDPAFFTVYPSSGALEFDIDSSQATTFVFRNDGIYISFWVNGVMVAKQATSGYTTAYQASAFSIGDDAAVGSDMTYMACSMLKAWNRALTDREIKLL